jgi:hypothetical protein
MRAGEPEFIRIASSDCETMVSTDRRQPSKLPLKLLKSLGLPDKRGVIHLTKASVTLHVTFSESQNDDAVTVWASRQPAQCDETASATECAIL